MRWRPSAAVVAASFLILALALPDDVLAQRARGGAPSGGGATAAQPSGGPHGGRSPAAGAPGPGHAVPRTSVPYRGYPAYRYAPYYRGWGYYPFYGYYGAFYGPWWGFGWGWGYPWYGYGAGYGYYGPYYYVDSTAGVRLQVTPREAEVYVDGAYAGLVDEFDGTFQRLRLPPGTHEIAIYLEGYKTLRSQVMVTAGNTVRIRGALQPLSAGEPQEPKPERATPPPPDPTEPGLSPEAAVPERGAPVERPWPPQRSVPPPGAVTSNFGTLAIRVQPAGADVLIDGERWEGPDGQQRLFVEVSAGRHRVEVRKDGYQSFVADVDVRRGDVTPLNVSLLARE